MILYHDDTVEIVEEISRDDDIVQLRILHTAPPPPPKGLLACYLRDWMWENSLSELDVAMLFNVSQSTVNRWRKGITYLPARVSKFIKESNGRATGNDKD